MTGRTATLIVAAAVIAGAALFVLLPGTSNDNEASNVSGAGASIYRANLLGGTKPDWCLEGRATRGTCRTRHIQPDRARRALHARRTRTDEGTCRRRTIRPCVVRRPRFLALRCWGTRCRSFSARASHSFSQRRIRSFGSFRQPGDRIPRSSTCIRRTWVTRRRGGKATRWWST